MPSKDMDTSKVMLRLSQFFVAFALAPLTLAAGKFDVRENGGAKADGETLDTAAIQKAVDSCAAAGGGQVYFPPGRYRTGTIHLRNGVILFLDAGARIVGSTNLSDYDQPRPPAMMPEAKWGKWHRGLIVGENVEDAAITGFGVIDGNKVFDPTGEERMRGPHGIVLVGCRRFALRGVTIVDAANYAIFMEVSDDVEVRDVKIVGGWDGVHWRGAPGRWCQNVSIIGCQFYTGDDAIAGRYWNNTVIQDCLINSSCNGIRVIGPVTRLTIANNLFRGPGEQPHRTSGALRRTNMLAGIILQPGAWDATRGLMDDVFIANNVMQNVASPLTIWTKPGNTVGSVTVSGLHATGVYRTGISVESWADEPITNVVLRNVEVEYNGGGKAWPADQKVGAPSVDARPLPAWGLYARNVQTLSLQEARFSLSANDYRPVIKADRVERLDVSGFNYTPVPGVSEAVVTNSPGNGRLVP
ncbi:MAG: glycoside hydrolase family 28 protein [Limisphaerales bacterium]